MNDSPKAVMLLSVIIVTYRSEGEIGACLASIPSRVTDGEVEVIVFDNSPDDATALVITRDFPAVRLIKSGENLGFSKANNRAYAESRGEFILFLNPDTVSNRAAYDACLKILREYPGAGIVSPRLVLADGQMDLASRRGIATLWDGFCRAAGLAARFPKWKLVSGYNLTYLDEKGTYPVGAVNGAFMLTSRSLLQEVGLFDEAFFMYCEDIDLCYRFSLAGYDNIYHGAVEVIHLKGSSSTREVERMSHELFVGARKFYLKHFNPRKRFWIKWKYEMTFWLWEMWANFRRRVKRGNRVRPV